MGFICFLCTKSFGRRRWGTLGSESVLTNDFNVGRRERYIFCNLVFYVLFHLFFVCVDVRCLLFLVIR